MSHARHLVALFKQVLESSNCTCFWPSITCVLFCPSFTSLEALALFNRGGCYFTRTPGAILLFPLWNFLQPPWTLQQTSFWPMPRGRQGLSTIRSYSRTPSTRNSWDLTFIKGEGGYCSIDSINIRVLAVVVLVSVGSYSTSTSGTNGTNGP